MAATPKLPLRHQSAERCYLCTSQSLSNSHEENIEIVGVVDVVWRDVPFRSLCEDQRRGRCSPKVSNASSNTNGQEDGMLFP